MEEPDIDRLVQKLKEDAGTVLDLADCCLSQTSLLHVLGSIDSVPLREIYLQGNFLGPETEGITLLCNIVKKNRNLRVVDLRNNHLAQPDIEKLTRALETNFSILDFKIEETLGESALDVPVVFKTDVTLSIPENSSTISFGMSTVCCMFILLTLTRAPSRHLDAKRVRQIARQN
jgi:hypothetical protein